MNYTISPGAISSCCSVSHVRFPQFWDMHTTQKWDSDPKTSTTNSRCGCFWQRFSQWAASTVVVSIQVFEYILLPRFWGCFWIGKDFNWSLPSRTRYMSKFEKFLLGKRCWLSDSLQRSCFLDSHWSIDKRKQLHFKGIYIIIGVSENGVYPKIVFFNRKMIIKHNKLLDFEVPYFQTDPEMFYTACRKHIHVHMGLFLFKDPVWSSQQDLEVGCFFSIFCPMCPCPFIWLTSPVVKIPCHSFHSWGLGAQWWWVKIKAMVGSRPLVEPTYETLWNKNRETADTTRAATHAGHGSSNALIATGRYDSEKNIQGTMSHRPQPWIYSQVSPRQSRSESQVDHLSQWPAAMLWGGRWSAASYEHPRHSVCWQLGSARPVVEPLLCDI